MTLDPEKVKNFLREVEILCRKYKVCISHEDQHGAFLLEEFDEEVMSWLKDANYGIYNHG